MDVQAYNVAVRIAMNDQISRALAAVSKDALKLHERFEQITKDIKGITTAANKAAEALSKMTRAGNGQFSGATRDARAYADAMNSAARSAGAVARAHQEAGRGMVAAPLLLGYAGGAVGRSSSYPMVSYNGGGNIPSPLLLGNGGGGNRGGNGAANFAGINGWNNGVPPGGWGPGGTGGNPPPGGAGGNAGGGHGGHGMSSHDAGMTNLMTAYAGFEWLNSIAEKGTDYERELARLRQMGLDSAQLNEAKRYVDAHPIANTSRLDLMRIFTDAQGSFRESGMKGGNAMDAAEIMMPILAKYEVASGALSDSSKAAANYNMRNLNKIVEIMGGLSDTKKAQAIVDAVFKASQASGRLVDENQLKQFVAYGSSATNHQGIRAIMGGLEPIIAEMGGSTTAVGLRTAYTRVNGMMSLPPKLLLREMNRLGMTDKTGMKQTDRLHELEATNVVGYAAEMMKIYRAHGITKDIDRERENAIIFGTNGAKIFNRIMAQMETIDKSLAAYDVSNGTDKTIYDPNNHVILARAALGKSYENLELALAQKGGVLERFTHGIDMLSNGIVKITSAMDAHPEMTRYFTDGAMIVTGLAGASGGLWVLNHAAGAVIKPLGLVGRVVLSLTGANSLPLLATTLGGLPAVITGILTAIAAFSFYKVWDWYKNGEMNQNFNTMTSSGTKGASGFNIHNPTAADEYRHLINPSRYPAAPVPGKAGQTIQVNSTINLDGKKVGEAVTNHQAKEANKPQSGVSGFDNYLSPLLSGMSSYQYSR
ncbi:hypothetical protein [Martelella alba]|uniref:Uncharacterized protein n=1 Tax=Martelella alba TaxID=2590451 RepID=A0ABY2SIC7_9HYPH|nr:hypothetical protein [Martelella alba]TKI03585.1 hypothetical protein FCN80_21140 [Martelella alba]